MKTPIYPERRWVPFSRLRWMDPPVGDPRCRVGWRSVPMKILSSLKTAKHRHPDCRIVRRRGRLYVICKSDPRFKARQR